MTAEIFIDAMLQKKTPDGLRALGVETIAQSARDGGGFAGRDDSPARFAAPVVELADAAFLASISPYNALGGPPRIAVW